MFTVQSEGDDILQDGLRRLSSRRPLMSGKGSGNMYSGFISKKYFNLFPSFLSSTLFVDLFSQFQVGSCKYQHHTEPDHFKTNLSIFSPPADYDTIETVTCKSHYIHDEERQRSLQHFIQIEDLPEKFTKVNLPSGLATIMVH